MRRVVLRWRPDDPESFWLSTDRIDERIHNAHAPNPPPPPPRAAVRKIPLKKPPRRPGPSGHAEPSHPRPKPPPAGVTQQRRSHPAARNAQRGHEPVTRPSAVLTPRGRRAFLLRQRN